MRKGEAVKGHNLKYIKECVQISIKEEKEGLLQLSYTSHSDDPFFRPLL